MQPNFDYLPKKMVVYTLTNGIISLTVKSKGAEMTSIKHVKDGSEYLWQPQNTIYWQRQSPLLFPIVGKLKDGQYIANGVKYPMNQHGFVRDMEFDWIGKTDNQVIFWLKDNTESQKQYPYRFELRVIYTLIENKVSIRYLVTNNDPTTMYFSIGGHPAFKCPLKEGDAFIDYFLEFEETETIDRVFLEGGLIGERVEPLLNNTNKLPLNVDLFREDAVIMKNLKSKSVRLKTDKHKKSVTLSYEGFPYLAAWTQVNAPFICIEPWRGLADKTNSTGDIREKEGIMSLEPGKKFECEYFITIE